MTEALDSDTALENPDAPYLYEPYYFVDNAARALRIAREKLIKDHGDAAGNDLQWGVRKIPRRTRPPGGG